MLNLTTHYMTSVNYYLILPKQHQHGADSLVYTSIPNIKKQKTLKYKKYSTQNDKLLVKQYLELFALGHGLGGRQIPIYFTYPSSHKSKQRICPCQFL